MLDTTDPAVTANPLKISLIEDLPNNFYDQHDFLFTSPNWLNVLKREYGYQIKVVADSLTKECFFYTEVNHLANKKIISLPFSDYCLPQVHTPANCQRFHQYLKKQYPEHSIIFKSGYEAQQGQRAGFGAPTRHAYYHRVATVDQQAMWANFSSSFKRGIKKAKKEGVTINLSRSTESLKTFYHLYYQLRLSKFGSIPQPYSFFEVIVEEFMQKEEGFFLEALHEGKVIASLLVLAYKKKLYYKFGCSDIHNLEIRPNNLLFDHLFQYAFAKGYTEVDLGLSGASASYEGLVRFKESMGGKRFPITYFRHDPPNYCSKSEQELRQLLQSITKIMVDDKIAIDTIDRLSKSLYKYFA